MENYETQARGCWTIQKVQKKHTRQCFIVSITPKIFENKIRERPTLQPTNLNTTQLPMYKERESPVMHVEQVSRNIREHGQLQILVETLTG